MSDDLLERATAALRDAGAEEPSAAKAAEVRAQLLAQSARRRRLRLQGVWQWAAVAIASLFVSTAMAHVIRVQLPRVLSSLRAESTPPQTQRRSGSARPRPKRVVVSPQQHEDDGRAQDTSDEPKPRQEPQEAQPIDAKAAAAASDQAEAVHVEPVKANKAASAAPTPQQTREGESVEPPAARARPVAPPRAPASVRAPSDESAPVVSPAEPMSPRRPQPATIQEPTAQEGSRAAAPPVSQTRSIDPGEMTAPAPDEAPESAELALFRRAQSLHLAHDPRAIAAWDAYLRVVQAGALVPEARYNRALALVRAHRYREARMALEPFAAGEYGEYRRQEAQALLSRLQQ